MLQPTKSSEPALRDHPDKNPNDIEAATLKFSKIQSAYELLSDEQERAWYDGHRDQIDQYDQPSNEDEMAYFNSMRNGARPNGSRSGGRGVSTEQLMQFFTTSAWSAFDDSPSGFFTTFRALFAILAAEEPSSPSLLYPSFGTSSTPYQSSPAHPTDIKAFYSFWTNFATEKEFAWKDTVRIESEMDRRTKRHYEKENARERAVGRREFNETVRELVMYLRRRDPRYLLAQSTLSPAAFRLAAAARLKADLALAAKERAAQLEIDIALYKASEQAWAGNAGEMGREAEELWGEKSEEEGEGEGEEGGEWCVACGRGFSSGGAWEGHERSRKHAKNLERLVKEMLAEDEALGLNQPLPPSTVPDQADLSSEIDSDDSQLGSDDENLEEEASKESVVTQLAKDLKHFGLSPVAGSTAPTSPDSDLDDEEEEEQELVSKIKSKRKSKKSKAGTGLALDSDGDEFGAVGMVGKKGRRKAKSGGRSGAGSTGMSTPAFVPPTAALAGEEAEAEAKEEEEEEELAMPVKKSRRAKKGVLSGTTTVSPSLSDTSTPALSLPLVVPVEVKDAKFTVMGVGMDEDLDGRELSKKDKRRAKEAAKNGVVDELKCNVCSAHFASRSKLFTHIKDTGHALAETPSVAGGGEGKAGGKGKKKR